MRLNRLSSTSLHDLLARARTHYRLSRRGTRQTRLAVEERTQRAYWARLMARWDSLWRR